MKATAIAPANIAFIKYWGKQDDALRLPLNDSLSMNLSGATTTTTVEFSPSLKQDEIFFIDESMSPKDTQRIIAHLDRIRSKKNTTVRAKVVTKNSFPKGTGIASSASGFAALTVAAAVALGVRLSEKEATILARMGSGSACRSIPDGFVLWHAGESSASSFAESVYPSTYWDIADVLCIVSKEEKAVSSTEGMDAIRTSPYWRERVNGIPRKIQRVKDALKKKNFSNLGTCIEEDCLNMHHVMQTQTPSLRYWNETTNVIMDFVYTWRAKGISVYFTIDAGPNVHLICEGANKKVIERMAASISGVQSVIVNTVAKGTHCVSGHLF